ncbi:DNA replication and repair protein RecF [Adlercreutzia sp. R25]|uniref:DNA replication and repair protein RecF n=1 Tax=Adlercreutzia shanghongiae TaxID=3111773 RepID=A0ABU6IVT1_9ACTN|nr:MULTISPECIES: DNA replication and repair protein RecF [unclassified Adlercreutzia]MEC4272064.1 DNA replication and repair protein RecF [Adlercreutzia sp. R25]MEC4293795.1 DNA replication and repair protein RecF [Adlercreutzia sp. R22]
MTLRIESLELRNFRNYDEAVIDGLGDITVLVGENAVGKTNLVEGIQLLTALASFRHGTFDQLVRHGESQGRAALRATDGNRQLDIELLLAGKTRKYRLNNKAKRPLDLKGLIPSVIFTPDDLDLVKGSNTGRRTALDVLGSQVNKSYYTVRRDYEKVVRHKNRLLKDEADPTLVEAIDEMLVTVGSQLTMYRIALFERLRPHMVGKYREISGGREEMEARYVPSWEAGLSKEADEPAPPEGAHEASSTSAPSSLVRDEVRDALSRALHERAAEERRRGRALVGPHSDQILLTLDGQDASIYGSQGQQRSIVLAYKLAEAAVIEEILDQKPVLLLDDVMSELDGRRRAALVEAMEGGSQTFITTANIDYFDEDMLARSKVVNLPLA